MMPSRARIDHDWCSCIFKQFISYRSMGYYTSDLEMAESIGKHRVDECMYN